MKEGGTVPEMVNAEPGEYIVTFLKRAIKSAESSDYRWPVWAQFNGTAVELRRGDTPETLVKRWSQAMFDRQQQRLLQSQLSPRL
jgi:hypothetical protein